MLTEDASPRRRTVVGEAAHIVARRPDGPRGDGPRPADIDGYDNLILLCPDHHKVVDDRPTEFPVARLRDRKRAHCAWVRECLNSARGPEEHQSISYDQLLLRSFGPSNWLCPPNANGPEIFIRVVGTRPAPMPRRTEQPTETASLLGPEDREDLIIGALNGALLTRNLRGLQGAWHWLGDKGWQIRGSAPGPEVTTAEFEFQWDSQRPRQSLGLRCSVLTGWASPPAWQRALLVSLDLSINVLELDRKRLPADIRHYSTPVPVPGALRLEELGELVSLLASEVGPIGTEILGQLTSLDPETNGQVAAWIQHDGISLDRFVDLTGSIQLQNASSSTRAEAVESWPFAGNNEQRGEQRLTRNLMADALQRNDYRRYQQTLDQMFGPASN